MQEVEEKRTKSSFDFDGQKLSVRKLDIFNLCKAVIILEPLL